MRVFVIAGEASGDALGAALMAGLRVRVPGVAFAGVGGEAMAAQGLTSRFPMAELSVMGLAEILPKYRQLKRRIRETADAAIAARPDVLIGIDSPDFCMRVARQVRAARPEQPVVHYVAPSVWAWRPGRARRMAGVVDHVLALLPFEPTYMQAAGMSCDFVGHPVVSEPVTGAQEAAAFRGAHAIAPDAPLVLGLPGSRRGEIERLAPRFGATLQQVAQAHPGVRVVVPTVPATASFARAQVACWPGAPVVLGPDDKRAAFAAADAALAASGTVSLELAAAGVPMVIGYDMAPLTRLAMAWMLRIDTVTLVNLVSETRAVPEFLGRDCRADRMAPALGALLRDGPERAAQRAAMVQAMARLGQGGPPPGQRAADSVLEFLGKRGIAPHAGAAN